MEKNAEKMSQAIVEYKTALEYIKEKNYKQAKVHLVRALRIMEDLYTKTKGLERAKAIYLYKKIARLLNEITIH